MAAEEELDFLKCSICLNRLVNPHCLPCLHCFCKVCLDRLIESQNSPEFDCPYCRDLTSIYSVKKDFRSEQFINFYKRLPNGPKSRNLCTSCMKHMDSFEAHVCKDCVTLICISCADQHRRDVNSSKHKVYSLSSTVLPLCSIHGRKLDLFCNATTCDEPICSICAEKNHLGHEVKSVDEKLVFYKDQIRHNLQLLNVKLGKVYTKIDSLVDLNVENYESLDNLEISLTEQKEKILKITNCIYKTEKKKIAEAKCAYDRNFQKEILPLNALKEKLSVLNSIDLNSKSFEEICVIYNNVQLNSVKLDVNATPKLQAADLTHTISQDIGENELKDAIAQWLGSISTASV